MSETYGFGDRIYLDDQFTAPFGAIVGSAGVVAGIDGELEPSYDGMEVGIASGFAFGGDLPGWWYRSTDAITKTITAATTGLERIDLIVLRFDQSSDAREVSCEVIEGTEATDPVAPDLTQNETTYDVPICEILVDDSSIVSLTDTRDFISIGGVNSNPASVASFHATISTSTTVADDAVIPYDTIVDEEGSNYDTSTCSFICPVDGWYEFNIKFQCTTTIDGYHYGFYLAVGGVQRYTTFIRASASNNAFIEGSCYLKASAGDEVQPILNYNTGSTMTLTSGEEYSAFSGRLVLQS